MHINVMLIKKNMYFSNNCNLFRTR